MAWEPGEGAVEDRIDGGDFGEKFRIAIAQHEGMGEVGGGPIDLGVCEEEAAALGPERIDVGPRLDDLGKRRFSLRPPPAVDPGAGTSQRVRAMENRIEPRFLVDYGWPSELPQPLALFPSSRVIEWMYFPPVIQLQPGEDRDPGCDGGEVVRQVMDLPESYETRPIGRLGPGQIPGEEEPSNKIDAPGTVGERIKAVEPKSTGTIIEQGVIR